MDIWQVSSTPPPIYRGFSASFFGTKWSKKSDRKRGFDGDSSAKTFFVTLNTTTFESSKDGDTTPVAF